MTIAARDAADWRLRAACRGQNTDNWFGRPTETSAAVAICAHCPVRAECLHECMQVEIPTYRYGVYGGLTAAQRRALPEGQDMTIAALRRLLDEIDEQGGPEAARHNRLHLPDDEGTPERMSTAPAPSPAPPVVDVRPKAGAESPELVTTSSLLRWAEDHPDPDVQAQGARAEAALTGLRQRYAADQELTAITTETEQLEKRLAELRAREAELAPTKAKKKRAAHARDYDSRTVRAWADQNGIDCPSFGQIPRRVLDAWRAREPK